MRHQTGPRQAGSPQSASQGSAPAGSASQSSASQESASQEPARQRSGPQQAGFRQSERRRLGRDRRSDPSDAGTGPEPDADPVEVAREIALRRLDQRPQTRAELASALRTRGVPDDAAVQVLDRFEEVGLVDDAKFAAGWAQSRHGARHLSRRAVALELRAKGVSAELIDQATATIDQDAELDAARQVASAKRPSLAGLAYPVAYRRLAGALARKGYGASVVAQVVRETLRGDGDDDFDGDLLA